MDNTSKYQLLNKQLEALFAEERDLIANAANLSAFIFSHVPKLNWAGLYFYKNGELVLGPFQGNIACVRIPMGRGVCGTAAATGETQLVPDVATFPGHIACDSASRSEVVVPLFKGEKLIGVLDVDSPLAARFTADDKHGLEALAATFTRLTNLN